MVEEGVSQPLIEWRICPTCNGRKLVEDGQTCKTCNGSGGWVQTLIKRGGEDVPFVRVEPGKWVEADAVEGDES